MCSGSAVGLIDGNEQFAFRGIRVLPVPERQIGAARGPGVSSRMQELLDSKAADSRTASWIETLDRIKQQLPAFAIWQIETLDSCFRQYCQVLQLASRDVRFRRNCIDLMANAERISDTLACVRQSRQWQPFNRAAFELRQDCELLQSFIDAVPQVAVGSTQLST